MAWSINTITKASSTDNWSNFDGKMGEDYWEQTLLQWEGAASIFLTEDTATTWTISDSGATDGES